MGYTADSVGTLSVAVRPIDFKNIDRAKRIVCMEEVHAERVLTMVPDAADRVEVWGIPDDYPYMDPDLVWLIERRLDRP